MYRPAINNPPIHLVAHRAFFPTSSGLHTSVCLYAAVGRLPLGPRGRCSGARRRRRLQRRRRQIQKLSTDLEGPKMSAVNSGGDQGRVV